MYAIYTLMLAALFHQWIFRLPKLIARELEMAFRKTMDYILEHFYPEQAITL